MHGVFGQIFEMAFEADYRSSHTASVTHKIASSRRAVKLFDSEFVIKDELINDVIATACLAPSAFNLQHWRVMRIKNKMFREEISKYSWNQPQISSASELIVVLLDKAAWRNDDVVSDNVENLSDRKIYSDRLNNVYAKNEILARDEAMRSSAMFSMLLMLAAEERGLRSCPMTGCDFKKIESLLGVGDDVELCMLIALGREAGGNKLRERQRLPVSKVLKVC
jgi:nitroreductase